MATNKHTLIYQDEPKLSPLRMRCRNCNVNPGQKCVLRLGIGRYKEIDSFHRERESDLNRLRDAERKMEEWNARYGKAI